MIYTFESKISTKFLEDFISLINDNSPRNVKVFNDLVESYEEKLLPKLSAREYIDLLNYVYDLLDKKYEDKDLEFKKILDLSWFKGVIKSSKLRENNSSSGKIFFIDFSEEEEEELLNFLFSVKYDVRADYGLMDRVHRIINGVFDYKFPYSSETDQEDSQSNNKEEFIKHSFEVLEKYNY